MINRSNQYTRSKSFTSDTIKQNHLLQALSNHGAASIRHTQSTAQRQSAQITEQTVKMTDVESKQRLQLTRACSLPDQSKLSQYETKETLKSSVSSPNTHKAKNTSIERNCTNLRLNSPFTEHPPLAQIILKMVISMDASNGIQIGANDWMANTKQLLIQLKSFYQTEFSHSNEPIVIFIDQLSQHLNKLERDLISITQPEERYIQLIISASCNILSETPIRQVANTNGRLKNDVLVQDFIMLLPKNTLTMDIIRTQTFMNLALAEKLLSSLGWIKEGAIHSHSDTTNNFKNKATSIEKLVNIKTAIKDTSNLFDIYIPALIDIAHRIVVYRPHQLHGNLLQARPLPALPLEDDPAPQGLLIEIPFEHQLQSVCIKKTQMKMRCLISAAHALVKLGNPDQRLAGISLIEEVKSIFNQSKKQVYSSQNPITQHTFTQMRELNEAQSLHNYILCKALVVQTFSGNSTGALSFIQNIFTDIVFYFHILNQFCEEASKIERFQSKQALAELFENPYHALVNRISASDKIASSTKTILLYESAKILHNINLKTLSKQAFIQSIEHCKQNIKSQHSKSDNLKDAHDFMESISITESLIFTLIHCHLTQHIQPLIDDCPLAAKPYLLAYTARGVWLNDICERLNGNRPSAAIRFISEESHTFWSMAMEAAHLITKAVRNKSMSIYRGVHALTRLTSTIYDNFHTKEEREKLEEAIQTLNDESEEFRQAYHWDYFLKQYFPESD